MLWLNNTSALQTRHLLTKYTCTHLTSRHLHTLALDSISLYTLAIYGTHFTSYNFTPLSLGALWLSSLHTLHKSLTHLTSLTLSHTHIPPHLFILGVCWLGNQLEASSFFFLNTLFTKLLDYSINMWLSFTSTLKSLEISHREIRKEHHGEISGMQENFLENFGEK